MHFKFIEISPLIYHYKYSDILKFVWQNIPLSLNFLTSFWCIKGVAKIDLRHLHWCGPLIYLLRPLFALRKKNHVRTRYNVWTNLNLSHGKCLPFRREDWCATFKIRFWTFFLCPIWKWKTHGKPSQESNGDGWHMIVTNWTTFWLYKASPWDFYQNVDISY